MPDRETFIRRHTALAAVPFVPEIRIFTASRVTPLWEATEAWLDARGLAIPFWAVPWAGGQAVARYVLDHPEVVAGKRVLDFGAGSGLVAIAAARAGAAHVIALDIDPVALAAVALNAEANGVAVEGVLADPNAALGEGIATDVVLAGDVWYERETATRVEAWLRASASRGVSIVSGDPARAYAPRATRVLARYDVPVMRDLESADVRATSVFALCAPGDDALSSPANGLPDDSSAPSARHT